MKSPTESGGISRLRRDKRRLILEAAVRVFARTGYHRARVSDIAKEAGIAYGLVYHYFRNKDEILATIFEEGWGGFLEALQAIADADASTEDKLVSVAALVLNAYRVRPEWVKVLVLEVQRSSRITEPGRLQALARPFQLLARILREGQARGELREGVDPEVASTLLLGGLEIVITAHVLDVLEVEPAREQEYHQKVARTGVDVFLHGLARSEPAS